MALVYNVGYLQLSRNIHMICIKIKEEDKPERDFKVERFPVTIGRSKGNTIRINNQFLSREHCIIEESSKGYKIVDLDSKNGLEVNGQQIKSSSLASGDIITIGNTTLVFIDEKAEPAEKKESEADSSSAPQSIQGKSVSEDKWQKQLKDEEIAECPHCKTFYSISYQIPGMGIFCPKCRTSHSDS